MPSHPSKLAPTLSTERPSLEIDSLIHTIGMITTIIESACLADGKMFMELEEPAIFSHIRHGRRERGTVLLGRDRAGMSLFSPLEGVEAVLARFLEEIEIWALRGKYMNQLTIPYLNHLMRTAKPILPEKLVPNIRSALTVTGRLDGSYSASFTSFARWLESPLLDLRTLVKFLATICGESNILPVDENGRARTPPGFYQTLGAVTEHIDSTIDAGSDGRSASAAAADDDDNFFTAYDARNENKENIFSQPDKDDDDNSNIIDLTVPSPPNLSPTNTTTIADQNYIHNIAYPTTNLLPPPLAESTLLTDASTPTWKKLLAKKGHPIQNLYVSSHDLVVFRHSLRLARNAVDTAEQCVRACEEGKKMAESVVKEWESWDGDCAEREERMRKKEKKGEGVLKEDWWGDGEKAWESGGRVASYEL